LKRILCGNVGFTEVQKLVIWSRGDNLFRSQLNFLSNRGLTKKRQLMRWALAIQDFNVKFKYKRDTLNTAADYLSRPGLTDDLRIQK